MEKGTGGCYAKGRWFIWDGGVVWKYAYLDLCDFFSNELLDFFEIKFFELLISRINIFNLP